MKKSNWTDKDIRALILRAKVAGKPSWGKDPGAERGKGTLELRASSAGSGRWYWRYTLPDRTTARIPLGIYGERDGELTLRAARLARDTNVALYLNPESRDVRAFAADQAEQRQAARAAEGVAKLAARAASQERLTLSVERLLSEYVAHLESAGKALSAKDAGNMFKNHVTGAFPAFAVLPAADLKATHVVAILRRLINADKPTTARKLRSYLRAAYALAVGAAHDPNSNAQMDRFGIKDNPVQSVKTIIGGSVAGERALAPIELKAYVTALRADSSETSQTLLLALYLAGQRMSQLLRVRVADVDQAEQTIVMEDPKGRRAKPRKHTVPYGLIASSLVRVRLARCRKLKTDYLFVNDEIDVAGKLTAASKAVHTLSKAMVADPAAFGLTAMKPFRMGDIRRTCETMLAPIVSKDIRAQLLSHGVSGVQASNYDRHAYLDEKRAAIKAWEAKLAGILSTELPDSQSLETTVNAA